MIFNKRKQEYKEEIAGNDFDEFLNLFNEDDIILASAAAIKTVSASRDIDKENLEEIFRRIDVAASDGGNFITWNERFTANMKDALILYGYNVEFNRGSLNWTIRW